VEAYLSQADGDAVTALLRGDCRRTRHRGPCVWGFARWGQPECRVSGRD
jgi:hypothetical protein